MTDEIIIEEPTTQLPIRETVGRMARTVVNPLWDEEYVPGRIDPETAEPYAPPVTLKQRPSVSDAFDAGAGIPRAVSPPPIRKTPTRGPTRKGGRPAGAEELQKLFAAGMILLIAFTLGDWAQPTQDEANELAAPLGNILARRIDVAAKLGADSNDVIAFSVAIMAYLVRVGPVAADKAKEALDERNRRARVERVRPAPQSANTRGAGGMAAGSDAPTGTPTSPAHSAIDAITQARDAAFGQLDRDLGHIADADSTMAAG